MIHDANFLIGIKLIITYFPKTNTSDKKNENLIDKTFIKSKLD